MLTAAPSSVDSMLFGEALGSGGFSEPHDGRLKNLQTPKEVSRAS